MYTLSVISRYLLNSEEFTLEENPTNGEICFFISSEQSHQSTPRDLGIPIPKGMFVTPNPSPVQSPKKSVFQFPAEGVIMQSSPMDICHNVSRVDKFDCNIQDKGVDLFTMR